MRRIALLGPLLAHTVGSVNHRSLSLDQPKIEFDVFSLRMQHVRVGRHARFPAIVPNARAVGIDPSPRNTGTVQFFEKVELIVVEI